MSGTPTDPTDPTDPARAEDDRSVYADMLSEYLARPPRREAFFEAYIDDPEAAAEDGEYLVRAFPVDGGMALPMEGAPQDPLGPGGPMGAMFAPPPPPEPLS